MSDLIWLRQGSERLEVENFGDIVPAENVVAPLDALREAQPQEERAKIAKNGCWHPKSPAEFVAEPARPHLIMGTVGSAVASGSFFGMRPGAIRLELQSAFRIQI